MSSVFSSSLFLSAFAGSELGLAALLRGFFRALRINFVSFLVMHGNFMDFGTDADSILGSSSNCLDQRCYRNSQLPADKTFRIMLPVWAECERIYKSEQCQPEPTLT
jgi:hypothetical protein